MSEPSLDKLLEDARYYLAKCISLTSTITDLEKRLCELGIGNNTQSEFIDKLTKSLKLIEQIHASRIINSSANDLGYTDIVINNYITDVDGDNLIKRYKNTLDNVRMIVHQIEHSKELLKENNNIKHNHIVNITSHILTLIETNNCNTILNVIDKCVDNGFKPNAEILTPLINKAITIYSPEELNTVVAKVNKINKHIITKEQYNNIIRILVVGLPFNKAHETYLCAISIYTDCANEWFAYFINNINNYSFNDIINLWEVCQRETISPEMASVTVEQLHKLKLLNIQHQYPVDIYVFSNINYLPILSEFNANYDESIADKQLMNNNILYLLVLDMSLKVPPKIEKYIYHNIKVIYQCVAEMFDKCYRVYKTADGSFVTKSWLIWYIPSVIHNDFMRDICKPYINEFRKNIINIMTSIGDDGIFGNIPGLYNLVMDYAL